MTQEVFRSDNKEWQEWMNEKYLVVTLFVVDCNAPYNVDSWVNFKIKKEVNKICRKVEDDCPRCDGTGRRGRGYCHRCGGHGTVLTKTCSCGCS
jgi:hypothetical protein